MFLGFSLFPFLDACVNPEEPVLESPLGVEVACERRLSVKLLQPAEHMQLVLTDFFPPEDRYSDMRLNLYGLYRRQRDCLLAFTELCRSL